MLSARKISVNKTSAKTATRGAWWAMMSEDAMKILLGKKPMW
jgi:hypothetical protein